MPRVRCKQCGLWVYSAAMWLEVEHCPKCDAPLPRRRELGVDDQPRPLPPRQSGTASQEAGGISPQQSSAGTEEGPATGPRGESIGSDHHMPRVISGTATASGAVARCSTSLW